MLDVDHFKSYNDLYGHPAGDRCLARVAEELRRALHRASDVAARYGGEEFAAILPGTDLRGSETVAEVLRARVEELDLAHAGSSAYGQVTVSIGAASATPALGGTEDALVKAADEALYRSKHDGRNRVSTGALTELSDEPPCDDVGRNVRLPAMVWEQVLRKAHETGRKIGERVGRLVAESSGEF
jgi:diguanylate cyclase (GGDEF)-like protein